MDRAGYDDGFNCKHIFSLSPWMGGMMHGHGHIISHNAGCAGMQCAGGKRELQDEANNVLELSVVL